MKSFKEYVCEKHKNNAIRAIEETQWDYFITLPFSKKITSESKINLVLINFRNRLNTGLFGSSIRKKVAMFPIIDELTPNGQQELL
ncbi:MULTISPECIES: hypothetical protein [unclassified Halomonas]|uniref:hypothetical protein n=1 Tax=unclassified Halomonas TaxID=2609666 RepID=UPI001EF3FD9A|nr:MULTISPECIES: hypothetical protein [unclassified Halomonas]MCP1342328.1 hypothetical protein [Halomonas sp. FL8]MCP1360663.1 hypothetical protein [Halomonas sp. BBD45]